jgi:ribosomal protein S18 acetylase RimI-like enzyme
MREGAMINPLVPSPDLVRRTLAAEIAYTVSRMQVAERIPGNPIGMAYRWVDDGAVGLMSRLPAFARVMGLRAGHERHIEPLVEWYREHGIKPTFEMVPALWDAALGRELARMGFYQSGFHASLICQPPPTAAQTDGDAGIEAVTTAEEMEHYLDAYIPGWGIPEKDGPQFRVNVRPWLQQSGWSLYLARVDGKPAAAATLYVKDRVAYLADAATDPSFRGRGLQTALLRRRIRDAGAAGADLVCSGADPFSTSHRNMERAGLRLQFIRSMWMPVP